jgi:hypothetical protein
VATIAYYEQDCASKVHNSNRSRSQGKTIHRIQKRASTLSGSFAASKLYKATLQKNSNISNDTVE